MNLITYKLGRTGNFREHFRVLWQKACNISEISPIASSSRDWYRVNEQFLRKSSILLLAAMLDDLRSSSNMAARKQNTFPDGKKSTQFLNLKLNSITTFPYIFLKVLVNVIALEESFGRV